MPKPVKYCSPKPPTSLTSLYIPSHILLTLYQKAWVRHTKTWECCLTGFGLSAGVLKGISGYNNFIVPGDELVLIKKVTLNGFVIDVRELLMPKCGR